MKTIQAFLQMGLLALGLFTFSCTNPNSQKPADASALVEDSTLGDTAEVIQEDEPSIPVTPEKLMQLSKHLLEAVDEGADEKVEGIVSEMMKGTGLERIPYDSPSDMFFGRDVELTEGESGFYYKFKSDDGFVVRTACQGNVICEAAFKNKAYQKPFEQGIQKLHFVMPAYEEKPENIHYVEIGGIDDFIVAPDAGDGVILVSYIANNYEEPTYIDAQSIINLTSMKASDAEIVPQAREYQLVKGNAGKGGELLYTLNCKLTSNSDSDTGFNVERTDEYSIYSVLKLIVDGDKVMEAWVENYSDDMDNYAEELARAGFEYVGDTDGPRTFKHKDGRIACVEQVENNGVRAQIVKN